jgi:hypothetical protein
VVLECPALTIASNLRINVDSIHRIKLPEKFAIADIHRMQKEGHNIAQES